MANIVILLILMQLGRVQEFIPVVRSLKPVLLLLAVGVVAHFLLQRPVGPGFRWKRAPLVLGLLFTVGLFLSVPTSFYPRQTLEFLLKRHITIVIMVLLAVRHLADFYQLQRASAAVVFSVLWLGTAIVIRPTAMEVPEQPGVFRYSVCSSYDPNELALVLAMCAPFLLYWFLRGGLLMKAISLVSGVLALNAIHLTGSRGGLLSLGIVGLVVIVAVKQIHPLVRAIMIAFALLGGALVTQTSTFANLVDALQGEDYNSTSPDGRLAIWKRGIGYAFANPITGVGTSCFSLADGELSGRRSFVRGVKWSAAHNSCLEILVENGFAAFFCWIGMLLATLLELRRQRRALAPWAMVPPVDRCLLLGDMVRAGLYAFLVGGMLLSMGYLAYLYLLIAFAVALGNITDDLVLELEEADEQALVEANSADQFLDPVGV